ncbi:hypothetical protein AF72_06750 [Xylella taiwanensis]|uniref:Uncharacterized protein n=1 Tax=Xylella taiwanensis TaxID=1444770 RepID=Z9JK33_9GAMM|nr:hypothetical protein AF72_06750 [Xylella taiwanensis]
MRHVQYDLTLRSVLIVTTVFFFALHIAINVFSIYQEYNSIKNAMKSLAVAMQIPPHWKNCC